MSTEELRKLADKFSEGWHEGIKIDASDVMLLTDAADALEALEAENLGLRLECQGLKAQVAEVTSYWKEAARRNRRMLEEYAAPIGASQPLTEDRIEELEENAFRDYMEGRNENYSVAFARAIERGHGIGVQP